MLKLLATLRERSDDHIRRALIALGGAPLTPQNYRLQQALLTIWRERSGDQATRNFEIQLRRQPPAKNTTSRPSMTRR